MGLYYGLDVAAFGMSVMEIPRATMAVYNQATMLIFVAAAAAAAASLASLHHCSLLSPYVAAPAVFLVGATM